MPPVDALTERVELAVPPLFKVTLVGFSDVVNSDGEAVADRVTVPTKLLTLVRVTVAVPEELA